MIKNTFYNSINLFVEQTIKSLSSNMYKEINKNDYENDSEKIIFIFKCLWSYEKTNMKIIKLLLSSSSKFRVDVLKQCMDFTVQYHSAKLRLLLLKNDYTSYFEADRNQYFFNKINNVLKIMLASIYKKISKLEGQEKFEAIDVLRQTIENLSVINHTHNLDYNYNIKCE